MDVPRGWRTAALTTKKESRRENRANEVKSLPILIG